MVATERPGSMGSLVNVEEGLISRDIFVSDEIYQQELEQIFARTWLFVGHTSQIPNPNDFFVSRMGEESVIMTRDRQGEVHVLLNTCRHRGMKVIRYDRGNTPVFSCPYHGWSYSTDGNLVSVPGELIGVPQFATAYQGELKKEEWGLISVPRMHIYKGSVWACWDKDVPDWDDYMGDMKLFLDNFLEGTDGDPEGRIAIRGVHKWVATHNWKFGAENFIGDEYHGVPTHRSTHVTGRRISAQLPSELLSISFPQGHGVIRSPHREEFGPHTTQPSTIFPNISLNGSTIAVWHPAGPRTTETWRWYFVDKNAPPEVRRARREASISSAGPTGRVETDDEENWVYATAASHGMIARRYPYNYEMGLGHARDDAGFPGTKVFDISGTPNRYTGTSEENQRGFYRRWAQLMDAEDGDEIRGWDKESGR